MAKKGYGKALGADLPQGTTQIVLFIPDRDRNGHAIDQGKWRDEALGTLGNLFRGATAFPPGKGVWRDDSKGGQLLMETVVMVVSYINPLDLSAKALKELRGFLHRFGREAHQGEVGIIVAGTYYGISKYDLR